MRIAVLTYGTPRGVEVVRALHQKGIVIDAIVIDRGAQRTSELFTSARRAVKHRGAIETLRAILKRLRRTARLVRSRFVATDFSSFSNNVRVVDDANGPGCEAFLRQLAVDLIVLGPIRIIRPHIITIPRIGILNAHPGLLPRYRGVDVIPWAIHNGDALGVTVHFVDAGVDTGPIVATREMGVNWDDTLGSLKRRANHLAAELMSEVVRELRDTGQVGAVVQTSQHEQYYRMPRDLLQQTEQKLETMKSRRRRWPPTAATAEGPVAPRWL